jgi:tetratricopeptide (TPR) repeat protein
MASPPTFDPTSAQAIIAHAAELLENGRAVEAVGLLQKYAAADPTNIELRFTWGVALLESGDAQLAAPVFLKTSRQAPGWIKPRLMLAKALRAMGRLTDALSVLRQTTQDMPDAADAWMQRGHIERESHDNAAAAASYENYLKIQPDDVSALNNLGVALRAQNLLSDAITIYKRALELSPHEGLLHANLGNALDAVGLHAEAEQHLRTAVMLMPDNADAQYNLAAHLIREEKPDDGVPLLREIVRHHPKRWDAWTNLGVGLVALGKWDEAEPCYRKALQLWPTAPELHYNLAWLLLLTGQWREGWAEYEWRWQLPNFSSVKRASPAPPWDGTPKPNCTILLHAEQGLGDTIQFVRFAKAVRQQCARVILDAPKPLMGILRTIDGIDEVISADQQSPPHDLHANLLSLPHLLKVTPQSIDATPYIRGQETVAPHLRLPPSLRRKIGFAWAGSPDNKIDQRRSCDARFFEDLARRIDADFISLQIGARAGALNTASVPNIVSDMNGRVADWTETAQIVSQLDLVISVDTAVAHLAGAMGKTTWILLPFSPDFRWLLERKDTPWYSDFHLFRQRVRGDWPGLFAEVTQALTDWIRSRT